MKAYNLALFAVILTCSAQETLNYGAIGGRITDPTGAVVQNAEITARQSDTNRESKTSSDREGRFRFPYLHLGTYRVTVRKTGFAETARMVTVGAGSAFDLPIQLTVEAAGTNITVSSEPAVLEAARSQISATIPQAEIQYIPLNGRSFLDMALLLPGVSPTNTASTQTFSETSAVPGQGISIASQRNFSNSLIVDGLSANDDAAGLSAVLYGVDAVHDFQVVTSGGQAEFGRALGGYLNVVTKSGTNSLHGDLYGYFRNQRLNAANALSNNKLPMTQAQYGASLGGPIVPDRTFYFANFEHRNLNQSGLVTIDPANGDVINSRLVDTGYPGPLISTGRFPNPVHTTNAIAKLDHQFSPRYQLTLRYSLYDVNSSNSRGAGALSAVTAAAGLNNTDHNIAIGNIFTISPRLVNEMRGQYTRSDLTAEPNDVLGPAVSISGVASFGRLSSSPTGRFNHLYELVDTLSYQAGSHAFRAGVDFLYNRTTITFPRAVAGSYSYSSLANFLRGAYNNSGFTQTFGNSVVSQSNPNVGIFVQDEWKLTPQLTVNLGLRYDLQFLQTIATDKNNVSPRIGFAWSPAASRHTVVRCSYGLFYDRVPLRALANALLSSENTTLLTPSSQVSVSVSPAQTGAPLFPAIMSSVPPAILVNLSTMNRHIQNAYSGQASFEVEQQIGPRSTMSIGYEHLRGIHLINSVNLNAPTCVASGTNNGCRPNPNYANNSEYSALADSRYDGLHVSFVQRPTKWGSYRVSYTYSKAMSNVGEYFFSSPIDNFNIWADWGRSDDDQRHRVVVNGTIQAPLKPASTALDRLYRGFQLSGTIQYYSALPFNIVVGSNTVQGTSARPLVNGVFIPRNSGNGFDLLNLNVRLSRAFQLAERLRMEAIAESFNALNHVNGVSLNGTFGSGAYPANPLPSFMRTTAVADPRTLQLALRLSF